MYVPLGNGGRLKKNINTMKIQLKTYKGYLQKALLLSGMLWMSACELETTPTDRFVEDNVLTTEAGIQALIYNMYRITNEADSRRFIININEVNTDLAYNRYGTENTNYTPYMEFNVSASAAYLVNPWNTGYYTIRDANIIMDNTSNGEFDEEFTTQVQAEARLLRAFQYMQLYFYYGPVPLRTSTTQDLYLPRADEDELLEFIETEIEAVVDDLPDPGQEEAYGRANKGWAYGILTRFFLNSKQWEKAASAAQSVIDLGYYALYSNYREMFFVENEENTEMVIAYPADNTSTAASNLFPPGAFPKKFWYSDKIPEFVLNEDDMANWATMYSLRDDFVNSFAANDTRFDAIITEYYHQNGTLIDLTTQESSDNCRSMKFFDPDASGNYHGNDQPIIRYADILLSRAEALNEQSGPSQDAVDLINQVRTRAGVDNYSLADVGDQDNFRQLLLDERGWEFYSEGLRRQDLIRNGTFISSAQARGISGAEDHEVHFPVPQVEITANPLIEQLDGFN